MRPRLWPALLIAVLPGCDIDFVAVHEGQPGFVFLRSEHDSGVDASLEVVLPRTEQAPLVFLGETELQAEAENGRWRYRTEPAVDTLLPRLEVEIRTNQVVVAPLPFVTRNGPAVRRENGDLEIPIMYGGAASDTELTWQVALVDSSGQEVFSLHSRSAPLPSPIVLNGGLVPATAVAAVITASRLAELPEAVERLYAGTLSVVRVPITGET